jgi:hypothetical protein
MKRTMNSDDQLNREPNQTAGHVRPLRQSKEINRVILECDPNGAEVDLSLLEHISPVGWENIILYGEYVLN